VIHIGLRSLRPLELAAGRFWLAGALSLAWCAAARPRLPSTRDAGQFLLCGLIGIALYNAFLNTGQRTVSSGAASFLINTAPIITALLATLFLNERFGRIGWLGSLVAFSGVAIIAAGQSGGLRLGSGATFVLLAAVCQATYFVLQRPLVPRYGALACAAYTIITGAVLLTPWLLPALEALRSNGWADQGLWAIIYLAVVPSAIGYSAWSFALGRFGAPRAANFLYLVPAMAMTIAAVLTGELPNAATIGGGLLAIAGVAIVNLRARFSRQS